MNKSINKQGDTDVKMAGITENADIKGTAEAEWDDFQLMGKDNMEERSYVAPPEASEALNELKRMKNMKVGQSILGVLNHAA